MKTQRGRHLYVKGETPINRFWSHVNKDGKLIEGMKNNCWEWICTRKNMNPQMNIDGVIITPSKFIWEHEYGKIDDEMMVIKGCRNVLCVRLDHLFLGNVSDTLRKTIINENGDVYYKCSKCKQTFPFTADYFTKDASSPNGFGCRCKKCQSIWSKRSAAKHWIRVSLHRCKDTHNKTGMEFELSEQDLFDLYDRQQGKCYWLGIQLVPSATHRHPFKPSIDRLDRTKGYVVDNVVLCCQFVNVGRNSCSSEDFIDAIKDQNIFKDGLWRIDPRWKMLYE